MQAKIVDAACRLELLFASFGRTHQFAIDVNRRFFNQEWPGDKVVVQPVTGPPAKSIQDRIRKRSKQFGDF